MSADSRKSVDCSESPSSGILDALRAHYGKVIIGGIITGLSAIAGDCCGRRDATRPLEPPRMEYRTGNPEVDRLHMCYWLQFKKVAGCRLVDDEPRILKGGICGDVRHIDTVGGIVNGKNDNLRSVLGDEIDRRGLPSGARFHVSSEEKDDSQIPMEYNTCTQY